MGQKEELEKIELKYFQRGGGAETPIQKDGVLVGNF